MSILPLTLTAAIPISQDNYGIDLVEQIERERKAFATSLKNRMIILASHRGSHRSRKGAQAPKAEPESFGAKLTAAIKSRLARRR